MSTTIIPFTFTSFHVQTCHNNRFQQAFSLNRYGLLTTSNANSRRSINTSTPMYKSRNLVSIVHCSILPGGPLIDPSSSSPGSWKGWMVGMLLTMIIPFCRNKWAPLLQLKRRVEEVVQTVEDITEAVEKVAESVEDMAEDVAEKLPAGKLKEAVILIEKAADRIGKDAHLADEVIDKLQEVDKEMETFFEHVTDQANEIAHDANEIAKEANEVAKEANEIVKEVNDLNNKASQISESSQ